MKSFGRSTTANSIAVLACITGVLPGCEGFARIGVLDIDARSAPGAVGRDASIGTVVSGDGGRGSENGAIAVDDCGSDNAARLSPTQIATLKSATQPASGQRYLYPYEGTVFPAGMGAPTVMWSGPATDALMLQLDGARFHYTGCLLPDAQGRVTIPEAIWTRAGGTSGGSADPIRMRLTTIAGGTAAGPLERTFTIAPDAVQATIHYMSYRETGVPTIFRLRAGNAAEPLFTGPDCAGCHSLTPNGTSMIAHFAGAGSIFTLDGDDPPALIATQRVGAEHAALHPRGALYVTTAHPGGRGMRFFSQPSLDAALFDSATGAVVPGSNMPAGAMLPAFSPSGALLAFNDFAINGGHGLAVVSFDADARSAANYREIFRDDGAYPGWPSFTPDERAIVFARGQTADFSSMGAGFASGVGGGSPSDLHVVDLQGAEGRLLAHAMGFDSPTASDGETYLPFGVQDLHRNYNPRMDPKASSEYAWVYFDSLRNYGNFGRIRQIWGAAIDRSTGTVDPSHPAFYVVGQDPSRLNLRAIAVEE